MNMVDEAVIALRRCCGLGTEMVEWCGKDDRRRCHVFSRQYIHCGGFVEKTRDNKATQIENSTVRTFNFETLNFNFLLQPHKNQHVVFAYVGPWQAILS